MADSEQLSISGKITAILEQRTGTRKDGGTWMSQEFVLTTEDKYPKSVCFEVWGADKIAQADLKAGDEVNIGINIESSEYKGKWYTKVKAWRVFKKGQNYDKKTGEVQAPTSNCTQNSQSNYVKDETDLPF